MTMPAGREAGVDELLDQLELVIARLASASDPIEDLVVAYEEGLRLLTEAGGRLERLAAGAGVPTEPVTM